MGGREEELIEGERERERKGWGIKTKK